MEPNTLDILYLSLSLSVMVLTLFLVWAIFYVIRILKDTHESFSHIRDRIRKIEETLFIGAKMAKTVKDFIRDQRKSKKS